MSTAAQPRPATTPATNDYTQAADVLVVFGISGDLAKVMTFHSLYRLEYRGLLDCPIVGVAANEWSIEELRKHARACIEGCGETIDEEIFKRFASRLSYVSRRLRRRRYLRPSRQRDRRRPKPSLLSGDPPFLFGRVIKGLAEAGTTKNARVVVEKPFGHDLASARALAAEIHQYIEESAALPDRPLPRQDGHRRVPLPALRQHDDRADLEPQPRRLRADHDGRELRRRGPRPLLRPGRRGARCRRQPPHAAGRGRRHGGPRGQRRRNAQGRQVRGLPLDRDRRPRAVRARPVRRLPRHRRRRQGLDYRDLRGSATCTSTTGAGRGCPGSSAPARSSRSHRPSYV